VGVEGKMLVSQNVEGGGGGGETSVEGRLLAELPMVSVLLSRKQKERGKRGVRRIERRGRGPARNH
jgi:hypothetical protein